MQTDSLYDDLKKRHNNYVFDAILVDGAIFLKDSLHGAKKSGGGGVGGVGGGWGGAAPPPFANIFITGSGFLKTSLPGVKKKSGGVGEPPPFANTFITGSERVHMGSVFAGAKILEATLRRTFSICRLLT